MLADEGMENVWWRHEVLAGAVRAAVQAWSAPGGLELNIQAEGHQSNAVTTVLTNDIDMPTLRRLAEEQAGLVLGVPLAGFEGRAFRIGHMGHLNPPMLLGTLGTIESVLIQMNAPMGGSGVAAAAAHIGANLS